MYPSLKLNNAVVLGGTNAHIPLIRKLKARKYNVLLIDYFDSPVAKKWADKHYKISTYDAESILNIARSENARLVISTNIDHANAVACYVSEKLNLPHPYSYQIAKTVTQKNLMKELFFSYGIPTPACRIIHSESELNNIEMSKPLIVKPSDSNSSKGVRLVENEEYLKKAYRLAIPHTRNGQVIVEEYKKGREICADSFVMNGNVNIVSLYEKFNFYQKPYVIQCFRSIRPAVVSENIQSEIEQILKNIIRAFNLDNTVLFIQTICTDHAVSVIEFGARAPGGIASNATELSSGFSMTEAFLKSWLGEEIEFHRPQSNPHIITTNSIYAKDSVFGYCNGYRELLANGTIQEFVHYKTKGMKISKDLSSSDRVAGYIVKAKSMHELWAKTEAAQSALDIYDSGGESVMMKTLFENVKDEHIFN